MLVADPVTDVELPTTVSVVVAEMLVPAILSKLDVADVLLRGGRLEPRASVVTVGSMLFVVAVAYGGILAGNDQMAQI